MNNPAIKRVAIYARVSTNKSKEDPHYQEAENQLIQLRTFCEQQKWEIVGEYIDHQSGGKSGRKSLDQLFNHAASRHFDMVLFWALDRFSREGVLPTLQKLQQLNDYNVEFYSYTESYLNTVGVFKDALISILATLAKQERIRQSERVRAGLDRAVQSGMQLGRPKIPQIKADEVKKLRLKGMSVRKISVKTGLSVGKISEISRPNKSLIQQAKTR